MLGKNMFVIELDESTQATIKEMVMDALDELGVYDIELVESAMNGRLCDLEDLISLDEISKNEISDIQEIKEIIIKDYYHNDESVYNGINNCDDSIEIAEIIQDILYNDFNLSYDEIISMSDDIVAEIIQEWVNDDVINNVIIDDVYKRFLDYVNEITHDMEDEIYMEDNCMHLDVEYDSDEIISIIERYNLNTLKKLQAFIFYNTNGLVKLGKDVCIEIRL